MKQFLLIAVLCIGALAPATAQKFMTRTGRISFFSTTPVENIEAHNNQATSILDSKSGEMVFQVLMKGFQFEKALMQEHFNEKYVESDKFPKASFKGKVTNLDAVNFAKDGVYNVSVSGDITIHGVTKNITAPGTLEVKGSKIAAKSTFPITLADYNIPIPAPVQDKIAKKLDIKVDLTYDPYAGN